MTENRGSAFWPQSKMSLYLAAQSSGGTPSYAFTTRCIGFTYGPIATSKENLVSCIGIVFEASKIGSE